MAAAQRPGYPKTELTAEQSAAKVQELLATLEARYGNRLIDVLEADAIRKDITYDDYLEIPKLLTLQRTETDYHDELIFKVYHQQTELWFRLTLHEMRRAIRELNHAVLDAESDAAIVIESLARINRYFRVLTMSYSVMLDGLSVEEFLVYRKAFGTSSGFQSSQFRAIEILAGLEREKPSAPGEAPSFYWERAARHLTTNEPTLTLVKFKEAHLGYLNDLYDNRDPTSLRVAFLRAAERLLGAQGNVRPEDNLGVLLHHVMSTESPLRRIANEMIAFDLAIIEWKQAHLKVAAKHLAKAPKGTGETNWAEYLARSIAEQRCFPELHEAKAATSL